MGRDPEFCHFKDGLFNSAVAKMLEPMVESMRIPTAMKCLDGQQRRVIHRAGPIRVDWPRNDPITS